MSKSRTQLEDWVATIDIQGRKVLDIGGSQLPILGRAKGYPQCNVILDLVEPHENKRSPDIKQDIQGMDMANIKYSGFDTVFCLEVMEYLYKPLEALMNMNRMLEVGGILYISFHFIYPVHKPTKKDYLRYTQYGAERLLKESGFKIDKFIHKILDIQSVDCLTRLNKIEGNKKDGNYNNHSSQGFLIKAIKI